MVQRAAGTDNAAAAGLYAEYVAIEPGHILRIGDAVAMPADAGDPVRGCQEQFPRTDFRFTSA